MQIKLAYMKIVFSSKDYLGKNLVDIFASKWQKKFSNFRGG